MVEKQVIIQCRKAASWIAKIDTPASEQALKKLDALCDELQKAMGRVV